MAKQEIIHSNDSLKDICIECKLPIPKGAKKCTNDNCGVYQDWRRFIGGPINLITIGTAIGVVVSILLNTYQIRDLSKKPDKDELKQITSQTMEQQLGYIKKQ